MHRIRTTSSQLHPQDQVRGSADHVVTPAGPGPPVLRRTLTFDGAGFSQETISPQPAQNPTVGKSSSAIELNTRTLMPRRSPGGTPTATLNLRRPASFKKPTTVEQQGAFSVGNELGHRRVADLQHYQDEAQEGVLDEDVQQGSREHRQESGQVDEDTDHRHQLRPRPEVLGSCFNYDASDRIFSPMGVAGDLASPVDHERVRKNKNLSGVAAQGLERANFPDHHTQHLRCPPGQATNRPPLGRLSPRSPTSPADRNNWQQLARESKWIPPEQGREMEARLKILIEKIEQQQETTRALLTEKLCREAELLHLQQRLQSGLPSPAGNGGTSTSGTSAALAPCSKHAVGDTATQKRSSSNYGLGMPPTAPGAAGGTKPSLRSLTGSSGGTAPQGSSAPPGSSAGRRRVLKKPCNAANASTVSSSKTRLLPDCQRMAATQVQVRGFSSF